MKKFLDINKSKKIIDKIKFLKNIKKINFISIFLRILLISTQVITNILIINVFDLFWNTIVFFIFFIGITLLFLHFIWLIIRKKLIESLTKSFFISNHIKVEIPKKISYRSKTFWKFYVNNDDVKKILSSVKKD